MALGRGHDFANLLMLPLCLYYTPREFYLAFTAGYLVGTFLLSPDLDLPHSKPSKRWKGFSLLWRPYQHLSKHRGLSHIPLLGTSVRLGYLTLLFLFSYFVLLGFSQKYAPGLKELLLLLDPLEFLSSLAEKEWVFYFALGVVASELFHVALDLLTSFFKGFRIARSKRRR
ncbi:MAG: metal-binding protein [Aquificaceae bacterium]|nr:metal-binding protein [Aquificaceae bacterium]MDW8033071.1 DUF2227 family putative metal-binding protein [Aquificaceae bacterium]